MTSPTTHRGNIGEAAAILDAVRRGWHVSLPMEGAAYDLIVDKGDKLLRVQVRAATPKNGVLIARLRYSTKEKVDMLAVYNIESGLVHWLPFDEITNTHSIHLRE